MNPSIKAISFIVALLASATILNAQNETQLWKKVEKAEKEGKPQTATIYLKQLEKIASDRGDELEKFYITEELYACISSFNWKEANVLYPEYSSAKKKLFDNLDANIEKYSTHKREIILLYERAKRHRSEILQKGENSICKICKEHPRFHNSYLDITETGIGLCCEEAARIIITNKDTVQYIGMDSTQSSDEHISDTLDFRKEIFDILHNKESNYFFVIRMGNIIAKSSCRYGRYSLINAS